MLTWENIQNYADNGNPEPSHHVEKSDDQWRQQLSDAEYAITRQAGTERPFSSESCQLFSPGRYHCVCCHQLLFDAEKKFDSGTGWPSFTQPASPNAIAYYLDDSQGRERIEVRCNVCQAHLGHVFPDGPMPSGLRYCINALALKKASDHR